jgi:hypothetical protein
MMDEGVHKLMAVSLVMADFTANNPDLSVEEVGMVWIDLYREFLQDVSEKD